MSGAFSGVLGAVFASNDPWRPLAHTFGIWLALSLVIGRSSSFRLSAAKVMTALVAAVVGFEFGKSSYYELEYSVGSAPVNTQRLVFWMVAAVGAGAVLGLVAQRLWHPDWTGVAALAAATGLFVADGYRRLDNWGVWDIAVVFDAIAVVAMLVLFHRSPARTLATVGIALPLAILAWAVVSLPDLIEQVLI